MHRRRAVILPAVLFVLILVGVLSSIFVFRVNADLASTRAVAVKLQTRLAAEAGIERVKLLLGESWSDFGVWYDNPDELHRIVVWSSDGESSTWGSNTEQLDEGATTYRFSIIADDPSDDDGLVRFGLTDESARVFLNNPNVAVLEQQLLILVTAALGDRQDQEPQGIVNAILDWQDADGQSRGEEGDTEGAFYRGLAKPYQVKNGPFSTVEELLLVKGVTKELLYGEDFDRNGLLTRNEDDGFETFPADNEDNVLNRGLYPYLTVLSYDTNVDSEGEPRLYLGGEQNSVRERLEELFPDDPAVANAIVTVVQAGQQPAGGGAGAFEWGGRSGIPGNGGNPGTGETGQDGGAANTGTLSPSDDPKSRSRQQRRPPEEEGAEDSDNAENENQDEETPADIENEDEGGVPEDTAPEDSGDAAPQPGPMQSPVSLLLRTELVGLEHLEVLLDKTTLTPPGQRLTGLINVNTAPPLVLRCIDGLTEQQAQAIVAARDSVDADAKKTYAWLVTEEVLDLETLERIAPQITGRGQQFTIEAIGYSNHTGTVTRLQVVLDIAGLVPQIIYYRDISYLGARYPLREEDLDNFSVR